MAELPGAPPSYPGRDCAGTAELVGANADPPASVRSCTRRPASSSVVPDARLTSGGSDRSDVDEIEVSTVVYASPEETFAYLTDFEGYTGFTEYLEAVRQDGDGGVGTRYDFVLSWWKLSYTATSEVTGLEPPERIDWKLVGSLDARGSWHLEEVLSEAPDDRETATRIRFVADYRTDSIENAPIDIPRFLSTDAVVRKIKPVALDEIGDVVQHIVAELEGQTRDVDLHVETGSGAASGDESVA